MAGDSHSAHDRYAKEARNPPIPHVNRTGERPAKSTQRELEDIVFTKADIIWVHHPHIDTLVITARVTNSNVHRILVDDGSVVDIIYLDAYKMMGLTVSELSPTTSLLYRFTRDHVIPKGIIKQAVIVGAYP